MTVLTATQPGITRKISKAKLAKSGGVDVEFDQTVTFLIDEEEREITGGANYAGRNLAHPDLLHSFDMMRAHLAIITEMPEAKNKKGDLRSLSDLDDDLESLEKFKVTSFSIGGSGDNEGVTLSGHKKLSGGRILNLNTPFTKFFDENSQYAYGDELGANISYACDEVNKYLDGKVAPSAQGEIPFGAGDENDEPS